MFTGEVVKSHLTIWTANQAIPGRPWHCSIIVSRLKYRFTTFPLYESYHTCKCNPGWARCFSPRSAVKLKTAPASSRINCFGIKAGYKNGILLHSYIPMSRFFKTNTPCSFLFEASYARAYSFPKITLFDTFWMNSTSHKYIKVTEMPY